LSGDFRGIGPAAGPLPTLSDILSDMVANDLATAQVCDPPLLFLCIVLIQPSSDFFLLGMEI
jgi:hypothetical protein